QLKVVAHSELKQWKSAAKAQQTIVLHYGDQPTHWRQLVAYHLHAKQDKKALATQRLGVERGVLANRDDLLLLSQLLLNQKAPYQAAELLQAAIDNQTLAATGKNLRLVSQAWLAAKEYARAIAPLKRLYAIEKTAKNLGLLANAQILSNRWSAAATSLQNGLRGYDAPPAHLVLLLGIAQLNLKHYQAAQQSFLRAAADQKQKRTAQGWLRYLAQLTDTGVSTGANG
ncbi:MAG: hypothetical protein ACPGPF_08570, partial [Pontibacterium sp.]